MEAKIQSIILLIELAAGIAFGRVMIPAVRRIKTGKFDIYIGDRFKQDGSEPRFGGGVIFLTLLMGLAVGGAAAGLGMKEHFALLCVVIYLTVLLDMGIIEDRQRDTKQGIGIKPVKRFLVKLISSMILVWLLDFLGFGCAEILLPFRLGYIELGELSVPVNALLITGLITAVEIHDCHKGLHETGIDGLCTLSVMIASLGLAAGFSVNGGRETAQLVCLCTAGSCGAFLMWSISPSKIYLGQSGGLVLGGAVCSAMVLSGLQPAAVFALAAVIIDAVCAVLQRAVFVKTKKLLLKGASLHEHLRAVSWGDYKIMGLFGIIQLMGSAAAIAFMIYENKLVI